MRSKNDPERPGRIMAQMAMAPAAKSSRGEGSLSGPFCHPKPANTLVPTRVTTASRRGFQVGMSRQEMMSEPMTKPRKRPAMFSGWVSRLLSRGPATAITTAPAPTSRGRSRLHSTALRLARAPFRSPRSTWVAAWAPSRRALMSRS